MQQAPKQESFRSLKHSLNIFPRKASTTTMVSRCFPAIETWHCNAETSDRVLDRTRGALHKSQAPKARQCFFLHHGNSTKIGAFSGRHIKHSENLIRDCNNFLLKATTPINFDSVKPVWLSLCLWKRQHIINHHTSRI